MGPTTIRPAPTGGSQHIESLLERHRELNIKISQELQRRRSFWLTAYLSDLIFLAILIFFTMQVAAYYISAVTEQYPEYDGETPSVNATPNIYFSFSPIASLSRVIYIDRLIQLVIRLEAISRPTLSSSVLKPFTQSRLTRRVMTSRFDLMSSPSLLIRSHRCRSFCSFYDSTATTLLRESKCQLKTVSIDRSKASGAAWKSSTRTYGCIRAPCIPYSGRRSSNLGSSHVKRTYYNNTLANQSRSNASRKQTSLVRTTHWN